MGILLVSGCSAPGGNPVPDANSVPAWVNNLPQSDNYLHAVGMAGPTYFYEDGVVRAADAARLELAKALSAHVEEITLIVETAGDTWVADETYILQALSSSTDMVMKHSEIVSSWVDRRGVIPGGQPGITYVLARSPKVFQITDELLSRSHMSEEE